MLVLTFTILPFGVLVLLLADPGATRPPQPHAKTAQERALLPPPRGPERAPRCMGSIVFEKNEHHAAWERSWPAPRRHQTTPRPRQDRPLKKYRFFINNIDFSLEKCRFGAKKGVLHYVLRRKRVILRKNDNFELEICVKAKKGRTALQPEASLSLIC